MKKRNILLLIIFCVSIFISTLALSSAIWYIKTFGDLGFSSVLYTLTSDNGGLDKGVVWRYLYQSLLPALLVTGVSVFIIWAFPKKNLTITSRKNKKTFRLYPFGNLVSSVISVVLLVTFFANALSIVGFPAWYKLISQKTTLYDTEYIDPNSVEISFPEKKRNLVYIYLESMETSFFAQTQSGTLEYNVIPELYTLAEENINFSDNVSIGGWHYSTNSNWTMASLISQTSGVPLTLDFNTSLDEDAALLPGITNINDILNENGYYQATMFGSNGEFAGRKQYYLEHNTDVVYDLYSAYEDGIVPEGYHVWWGMEDKYLYEYAKQKLTEISDMDKPFAFSMLTADTHHTNGYICDKCENEYDEQYENVYACASKQVFEFVEWLKTQDFYENTTVIICGDHQSMDAAYFNKVSPPGYARYVYNCIINSPVVPELRENRNFTSADMFPTTLAALGCTIEGDRLGLGTNLFSDTPTLPETIGFVVYNTELGKSSDYYNKFLRKKSS